MIKAGRDIYRKKVKEDEREGGRVLYRTKAQMVEKKRGKEIGSWCEKVSASRVAAPLILDPTEGGKMVEKIEGIVKEYNEKEKVDTKVVERGGIKMSINVKSNPLGKKSCWSNDCPVCKGGDEGRNCRARGAVYEQRCQICKREGKEVVYYGETGRNVFCVAKSMKMT